MILFVPLKSMRSKLANDAYIKILLILEQLIDNLFFRLNITKAVYGRFSFT